MKYLFEYLSDKAVAYRSGLLKIYKAGQARAGRSAEELRKRYKVPAENNPKFRDAVISYVKRGLPGIMSADEELIHRDDWDFQGLTGASERQLMHPHYWSMMDYLSENHKKQRDILTVRECSVAKPYYNAITAKKFWNKYRAFSDFGAQVSCGFAPYEMSKYYPYRYNEWNHLDETPDLSYKYALVSGKRFLKYIKGLGYKHVIVVMQGKGAQMGFDLMYEKNIEGCRDWMHIITDDSFRSRFKSKYSDKYKNNGLLVQRMLTEPDVFRSYERVLNDLLDADQKTDFKKLKSILRLPKSSRDDELKKFNEEHGVEPYVADKGTSEFLKLHDPEKDWDGDMVKKFKSYIRRFFKKQVKNAEGYVEKQKDKEVKTLNKDRYIFTTLDMLLDYHKASDFEHPEPDFYNRCKDVDVEYWSMYKALSEEFAKDDESGDAWARIPEVKHLWYYRPVTQGLGMKEKDVISYINKHKLAITNPIKRTRDLTK